ncbi:helix-turn-helix transcriptional regulator [Bacillus sp. Marseille-P3661]|uniref:helix-turn-helix transcriptional regulator n=1 Tax=Bacillus sp. Marseille-P3661 TaxID=1936234 RepID=UPI000C8197C5|nr:helix-turn-helix transcriptional regulator [Bacillus sp. Marseille-P3661]
MNDKDLFKEILGKHLHNIRVSKGFTQEGLAKEADADSKNIGRNERGEKLPNSYTLYKLQHSLDFSVDKLFKDIKLEMESIKQEKSDDEE